MRINESLFFHHHHLFFSIQSHFSCPFDHYRLVENEKTSMSWDFFFWREFRFSNKKMTIYIAISFFTVKFHSNWIELNMAERQIYKQNKKILYMRKNLWIFSYYFSFSFRFLSHTHTHTHTLFLLWSSWECINLSS